MTYELEGPDVYQGMNPSFVRQVWAKRRKETSHKSRAIRPPGKPGPRPKWTEERKAQVAELLIAGKSSGQIAKALNVTTGAISGIVHKYPELKAIGFRTVYAEKLRRRPTP